MHGAARGAWRQRLDAGQDCRWHEQQHDRDGDDLLVPGGDGRADAARAVVQMARLRAALAG